MKRALFLILALALLLSACTEAAPESPVPLPSPKPNPESLSLVEQRLEDMSLREKVWQMLYVFPENLIGEYASVNPAQWAGALEARPAGGIVFVSENMPSEETLRGMIESIEAAGKGVFLGLDEEGGKVARLSYTLGVTTDFEPMYEYRDKGRLGAFKNARTIASDISSFGFNMDFAPVADVWTNKSNTVIGPRAYSHDPVEAAALVTAAVRGFHEGGVISVLKHFPGHGNTLEDSHYYAAHTKKSLEEMRECEFLPFIGGISAGAEAVMVGHIIAEDIDPERPATLSPKIIGDILRDELGFEGLVMTDAFTMAGLGDAPESEAAVEAILAGCDIILAPADPDAVHKAIMENISEERIDESVARILKVKYEWGIME